MRSILNSKSLFDQVLPVSGEFFRKLDVKCDDKVSSLGRILGQRHAFSSHHFLVSRAGVLRQTNHRQENSN